MRKRKINLGWAEIEASRVEETGKKVLHIWLPGCAGLVSVYSSGHIHLEAREVEELDGKKMDFKPIPSMGGKALRIEVSPLFSSPSIMSRKTPPREERTGDDGRGGRR